ncbi:hypothetical protein GURKE_02410 [Brevundimonas phage vB_BpoS-Gurke]|uniref:Uncharacterized protein n=1 Tax=Brevundimonas phage vB_BpoS-Gurke TaxID=2948599 RepID=A0A9E7N4A9_9CAUD|nr:hypothetical protein GURKE_02410 [Brevundimonas phage vB_BpoS-Gurke]
MSQACEHDYVYTGVRFKEDPYTRAGGSARDRYYAHVFHCRRCLAVRSEQIGCLGTSFDPVQFDATPAADDEVMVPKARYY